MKKPIKKGEQCIFPEPLFKHVNFRTRELLIGEYEDLIYINTSPFLIKSEFIFEEIIPTIKMYVFEDEKTRFDKYREFFDNY